MSEISRLKEITDLVETMEFSLSSDNTSLRTVIEIPGNRKQTVHLHMFGKLGNVNIVEVATPIVKLDDEMSLMQCRKFLESNGKVKIGALGIQKFKDGQVLVLRHNLFLETVNSEELKMVILTLAMIGDEWENSLTGGEDVN